MRCDMRQPTPLHTTTSILGSRLSDKPSLWRNTVARQASWSGVARPPELHETGDTRLSKSNIADIEIIELAAPRTPLSHKSGSSPYVLHFANLYPLRFYLRYCMQAHDLALPCLATAGPRYAVPMLCLAVPS